MIVGVPKEIKADEYRIAMLPVCVEELTSRGHTFSCSPPGGLGSGIGDHEYLRAGAKLVSADEILTKLT